MNQRPPSSACADTLFPYTTLCRSRRGRRICSFLRPAPAPDVVAQSPHLPLQLHDLAVRTIELGARGHAEQRAGLFDFALYAAAQAHLRVDQLAVDLAEHVRQTDIRVGVLRDRKNVV